MKPVTETDTTPLSHEWTVRVLDFLGVRHQPPTAFLLENLVSAYVRRVPWESAFRIARCASEQSFEHLPRWPKIFWRDAIERGGGGTCFESNYAFFSLLRRLGYNGYLTINNMGDTQACHTASIIRVRNDRWLVDVGLPVYTPIPISSSKSTSKDHIFHRYTVIPCGGDRYQIERGRHPKVNAFTLIDHPVSDRKYRAALAADYDSDGYFLDRVIITKVIKKQVWRFCHDKETTVLETFHNGTQATIPLTGDVPTQVGSLFGLAPEVLRTAMRSIGHEIRKPAKRVDSFS